MSHLCSILQNAIILLKAMTFQCNTRYRLAVLTVRKKKHNRKQCTLITVLKLRTTELLCSNSCSELFLLTNNPYIHSWTVKSRGRGKEQVASGAAVRLSIAPLISLHCKQTCVLTDTLVWTFLFTRNTFTYIHVSKIQGISQNWMHLSCIFVRQLML